MKLKAYRLKVRFLGVGWGRGAARLFLVWFALEVTW